MTLDDLIALLDKTPVAADIAPASLLYLPEDVIVYKSALEAALRLDDPQLIQVGRWLITDDDPAFRYRFPTVHVEHNPLTPKLNDVLYDRFDMALDVMLRQSQIAAAIVADAADADVIFLMLVDGLSYADMSQWMSVSRGPWKLEPALVDVPAITNIAFPNIIGAPAIAELLFAKGFHRRVGFSYWTREDNALTDTLFRTIPVVNKTGDFEEVVNKARLQLTNAQPKEKTYIQILCTGLDGYAHHQKRQPPIPAIVDAVCQDFARLVALAFEFQATHGQRVALHLTADHGILWRHEFEAEYVGQAPTSSGARWCLWSDLYNQTEKGRRFLVGNRDYYCLGYPKLRRPLRIDEQGVHGGISFQESIVPFITVRV